VLGKRLEMPALRHDGTEFPVELSVVRIPHDGAPVFTGFIRDVSDRKQREAALLLAPGPVLRRLFESGILGWPSATSPAGSTRPTTPF